MSALKTAKMSNYRWVICAMLFFATTVNYLDRQVLSLTYPGNGGIQEEFGWSDDQYGSITAVFSIFYAVCMLFAGKFIDWMGTKKAKYLKRALILEEGLPSRRLKRIVASLPRRRESLGCRSSPADTKVVERGRGDGLYINTAGIGVLRHPGLSPRAIREGDRVLVSGTLGDHGTAVMLARSGLMEGELSSDCAALNGLVEAIFQSGARVRAAGPARPGRRHHAVRIRGGI